MEFLMFKELGLQQQLAQMMGNGTPANGESGDTGLVSEMNSKTVQYFFAIWPILMSFGLGGSLLGAVYAIIAFMKKKIMEKWVCSIELNDNDPTYKWVRDYLKDEKIIEEKGSLKVQKKELEDDEWVAEHNNEKLKPKVEYNNGTGQYFIKFKGRTIWISHTEGKTEILGWERRPTKPQYMSLNAYGTDTTILKEFIDKAIVHSMKKETDKIAIYELGWCEIWFKKKSKKPRSIESVVLDSDLTDRICADIKDFQNSSAWYIEKGVPFRRGYLLYGPPGTGKTSFTQAIAGKMELDICYLNLSGDRLDDDGLNRALNNCPKNSIILLEDIDGIFVEREQVEGQKRGRYVTFSGLLNALDGVRSQEGRILFMTTNHKEKLDPALLRPGRTDFHAHLNNASYIQMVNMFKRFNPDNHSLADQFAKSLPEDKLSMAKLQGHLMKYRNQPDLQVKMHQELLEDGMHDLSDMTITEYLRRLNISKYAHAFSKKKVYFLSDLRFHADEGSLESKFGIKDIMIQKRIVSMVNNDKKVVEDFALLSDSQARCIIRQFVHQTELQDQLVEVIKSDTISGFQLKDICTNNYEFKAIKNAIVAAVAESELFENSNAMTSDLLQQDEQEIKEEESEDEFERKERIGFPSHNIEELMTELGLKDKIEKLKECEIDGEVFWDLTDEVLKDQLDIKIHGQRKTLLKRMEDIKNVHEKDMELKHELSKRIETTGIQQMLRA